MACWTRSCSVPRVSNVWRAAASFWWACSLDPVHASRAAWSDPGALGGWAAFSVYAVTFWAASATACSACRRLLAKGTLGPRRGLWCACEKTGGGLRPQVVLNVFDNAPAFITGRLNDCHR